MAHAPRTATRHRGRRRARHLTLLWAAIGGGAALAFAPAALGQGESHQGAEPIQLSLGGYYQAFFTLRAESDVDRRFEVNGTGPMVVQRVGPPTTPGDTVKFEVVSLSLQGVNPTFGDTYLYAGSQVGFPPGALPGLGGPGSPSGFPNSPGQYNGDSYIDFQGQLTSPNYPLATRTSRSGAAAHQAGATALAFARTTRPVRLRADAVDSLPPNAPRPIPKQALAGDHYKCYRVLSPQANRRRIRLRDQFGRYNVRTILPSEVCNPVRKSVNGRRRSAIRDTRRHLVSYRLTDSPRRVRQVSVQNQFGNQLLSTGNLLHVMVPTTKLLVRGPRNTLPARRSSRTLDHFACYQANGRPRARRPVLTLID